MWQAFSYDNIFAPQLGLQTDQKICFLKEKGNPSKKIVKQKVLVDFNNFYYIYCVDKMNRH